MAWNSSNPLWRYQHAQRTAPRPAVASGSMAKRRHSYRSAPRRGGGGIRGLLRGNYVAGAVGGVAHTVLAKMNLGVHLSGAIGNAIPAVLLHNPTAQYVAANYAAMYGTELATGSQAGSLGWNF